jgi:hypothetical protein
MAPGHFLAGAFFSAFGRTSFGCGGVPNIFFNT